MAKGITKKEPDPRVVYADIIGMPHWQSPKHPHMSLWDRAAQFAPFAALTGFEGVIGDTAERHVAEMPEMYGEDEDPRTPEPQF